MPCKKKMCAPYSVESFSFSINSANLTVRSLDNVKGTSVPWSIIRMLCNTPENIDSVSFFLLRRYFILNAVEAKLKKREPYHRSHSMRVLPVAKSSN